MRGMICWKSLHVEQLRRRVIKELPNVVHEYNYKRAKRLGGRFYLNPFPLYTLIILNSIKAIAPPTYFFACSVKKDNVQCIHNMTKNNLLNSSKSSSKQRQRRLQLCEFKMQNFYLHLSTSSKF